MLPAHTLEQRLDISIVAMVATYGDSLAAGRGDAVSSLVDRARKRMISDRSRAPGNVNRATVLAQRLRNPLACASAGAGDDRYFSFVFQLSILSGDD
jgi:hypothetical protein